MSKTFRGKSLGGAPIFDSGSGPTLTIDSIIDTHGVDLDVFLTRRVESSDERDEVRQTVYERLLNVARLGKLDGVQNPQAFIRTVARNILTDRYRQKDTIETGNAAFAAGIVNGSAADYQTPERILLGREMMQELEKIVDELPPDRRRLFVLNRVDGYSVAEIAEMESMTTGAVYKSILRVVVRCQNALYEKFDAPFVEEKEKVNGHANKTAPRTRDC